MVASAQVLRAGTFRDRAADRLVWESRQPARTFEERLVCVRDESRPEEDRHGNVIGEIRYRGYADRGRPLEVIAVRVGDGPISWTEAPQPVPPPSPKVDGWLRRWHGRRPAGDGS